MESLETFHQNRRVIEALSRNHLAPIPTQLGRFLYLAAHRDLASGTYRHPDLELSFSPASVNEALAYCHRETFDGILELPLDQVEVDARRFLNEDEKQSGRAPSEAARLWLQRETYRLWVPPGAPPYLADLFVSNMRVVLRLIAGSTSVRSSAAV